MGKVKRSPQPVLFARPLTKGLDRGNWARNEAVRIGVLEAQIAISRQELSTLIHKNI
jgi:hypothetical protein